MRTTVYSNSYKKYASKLYRSVEHIRGRKAKIIIDLNNVINLLENDLEIPDRYKPHKLKNSDLWDIHLLSKTSDVLLLYKKYNDPELGPVLFIKALTDHRGLDEITAMLLAYGLTEQDLLIDP